MAFLTSFRLILLILFTFNGNVISDDGDEDCEPYKDETCFKLYDNAGLVTYVDAENLCKNQSSHLSSIDSQDKQNFIENFLRTYSVVDNVWLGLKFTNGEYVWPDGSQLTFSNWEVGSPKNTSDNCVQITTDDARFGEWSDVACTRKNVVLCEKTRMLSDEELQNAVKKLLKNPVPIGFIYVQLPNEKLPGEIWPSVVWTDVSSDYAGLFFRTEGGESSSFGEIQEESAYSLLAYPVHSSYEGVKGEEVRPDWYVNIGTTTFNDESGNPFIALSLKRKEVRPRNTAIRIWKRTE